MEIDHVVAGVELTDEQAALMRVTLAEAVDEMGLLTQTAHAAMMAQLRRETADDTYGDGRRYDTPRADTVLWLAERGENLPADHVLLQALAPDATDLEWRMTLTLVRIYLESATRIMAWPAESMHDQIERSRRAMRQRGEALDAARRITGEVA